MNQNIWDQNDKNKMLEIFNQELKARGTCLSSLPVGKNFEFDSKFYILLLHLGGKTTGCHNCVICLEKKRAIHESQETDSKNSAGSSTNLASGVSTVLLQTIDLIVEGTMCEKQIKVKVLFDQSSQRSHVTKRVTDLLKLKGVSKQSIGIKTFGDKKSKNSILENVFVKLKNDKNEKFEIKALCTNLICLSINNQPVCDIQSITNRL